MEISESPTTAQRQGVTGKVTHELLHPLELNDSLAFEMIETVTLEFLEKEANVPIPRYQDVPRHAFGRLSGTSVLVSISHGWLFQKHPDPYGAKLDLVKNVFAPRLRETYPNTDIQVFFDFISTPQEPRTDKEDDIFSVALERMNSMYLYADIVLLLDVDLPKLDMTLHTATIDISRYTVHLSSDIRFDRKIHEDLRVCLYLLYIAVVFGLTYPVLGGKCNHSPTRTSLKNNLSIYICSYRA